MHDEIEGGLCFARARAGRGPLGKISGSWVMGWKQGGDILAQSAVPPLANARCWDVGVTAAAVDTKRADVACDNIGDRLCSVAQLRAS